jgi:hypothetical protein
VDNRSEPRGWLADGSPDGTDPQDADQATTVRTALSSAPDAGTADFSPDTAFSADPGFGSDTGYSDAGFASAQGGSEPAGSHANGSYGYSAASPSGNGGSSSVTMPPSPAWSAGAEAPPPPPAGPDLSAGSYSASGSGSPASPGYDAYGTSSAAAPPAPAPARSPAGGAPFPSPGGSRPKGSSRLGKSSGRPAAAQRPAAGGVSAVSTRRAQLTVSRIEPWSVMKFSFMISLVGWVILFVAVSVLYFLLAKLGVFSSIENTVGLVTAGKDHPGTDASSWFSASRVLGYTMLAGAVNVILITALATVGSVLYNLVTLLAGGIEVTLKETE